MKSTGMYPKYFSESATQILKKNGFEITFLTSRDNKFWKNNARKYAIKWLKKFKFAFNDVVAYGGNKAEFCKQNGFSYLIEDRQETAELANEIGIKSILILNEYNHNYQNANNFTASCWKEICDYLIKNKETKKC